MSKPVLYYTLIAGYSVWGYPIMKVTSETKNQVYGSVDGESSHRRKSDIKGKFKTLEEAESKREAIKKIIESYEPKYSELSKQMNALHFQEIRDIEAVVNG